MESSDPKILKEAAEYTAIHVVPKVGTHEMSSFIIMVERDIEQKKISQEAADHLFWVAASLWFSNLTDKERQYNCSTLPSRRKL